MDYPPAGGGGSGGPRRPGNLWTAEARDDMFSRREAGETWETICVDYPNRSRHAMQQQYSMMKKQRAMANGTWSVNKRGRKRKQSAIGERKPPVRRREPWFDETEVEDEESEDDEFADHDADESEEQEEAEIDGLPVDPDNPTIKVRPALPLRSATDPLARSPKSKIVTFPLPSNSPGAQFPSSTSSPRLQYPSSTSAPTSAPLNASMSHYPHPDMPRISPHPQWSGQDSLDASHPSKRRRIVSDTGGQLSAQPNARPAERPMEKLIERPYETPYERPIDRAGEMPPMGHAPLPPQPPVMYAGLPGIMFSDQRVREILAEGQHIAHTTFVNWEAEKSTQRQTFEASVSRANRRAHDSHEKLRNTIQEHAEALKNKDRERQESETALRRAFYDEVENKDEAHARQSDALKRTIHAQQNEREELEKQLQAAKKIIKARFTDPPPSSGAEDEATAAKKEDLTAEEELLKSPEESKQINTPPPELQSQLAAAEERLASHEKTLALYDQLRLAISIGVKQLRPPQDACDYAVRDFVLMFRQLSASIIEFNHGLDDMSMKAIVKAGTNIQQELEESSRRLEKVARAAQTASKMTQDFIDEYSGEEGHEERRNMNGTALASTNVMSGTGGEIGGGGGGGALETNGH